MATTTSLLRDDEDRRVTNIELFFDLVYVFAVTQLSHHLLEHTTVAGAWQTAVLLALVWQAWVYTTWVTNWLDPDRTPVRMMLIGLMLASLVMSVALPRAFADRGSWVAGAWAVMQIGRTLFVVGALRKGPLRSNFDRVLAWCVVSGGLVVAGGFVHGGARGGLWAAAVAVDTIGAAIGFRTPGLGRSTTRDWTISGDHMAERCQAFILIALGESVVVIGTTLTDRADVSVTEGATFVAAFLGAVALWWVYFDRSAEAGARIIAASADPGRLGRSAFHYIHPIMVAGIIVTAAADARVLDDPTGHASAATAWLVLGGTALFLLGHAAYKATVWRVVPWTRLAVVVALGILGLAATSVPSLLLGAVADALVVALLVDDRRRAPGRTPTTAVPRRARTRKAPERRQPRSSERTAGQQPGGTRAPAGPAVDA